MKRYSVLNLLTKAFFIFALIPALLTGGCKPSSADVETALKNYLEKNPQYLDKKIDEVLKKKNMAQQRPPEPTLEELMKKPVAVDLNGAPVEGNPNAPITIVTFSDFQCPFCSRVGPTIKQVMKQYEGKVRYAFRFHPLPFHNNAMSAAKAALAANAQGKFWQMHDALFDGQKDLSDDAIIAMAKKIGLNVNKFKTDWKSDKFDKQIAADLDFSNKNGASGTPAFFINGIPLKGARPLQSFTEIIDKLLEQKGQKPAAAPAGAPGAAPAAAPKPETQPKNG